MSGWWSLENPSRGLVLSKNDDFIKQLDDTPSSDPPTPFQDDSMVTDMKCTNNTMTKCAKDAANEMNTLSISVKNDHLNNIQTPHHPDPTRLESKTKATSFSVAVPTPTSLNPTRSSENESWVQAYVIFKKKGSVRLLTRVYGITHDVAMIGTTHGSVEFHSDGTHDDGLIRCVHTAVVTVVQSTPMEEPIKGKRRRDKTLCTVSSDCRVFEFHDTTLMSVEFIGRPFDERIVADHARRFPQNRFVYLVDDVVDDSLLTDIQFTYPNRIRCVYTTREEVTTFFEKNYQTVHDQIAMYSDTPTLSLSCRHKPSTLKQSYTMILSLIPDLLEYHVKRVIRHYPTLSQLIDAIQIGRELPLPKCAAAALSTYFQPIVHRDLRMNTSE